MRRTLPAVALALVALPAAADGPPAFDDLFAETLEWRSSATAWRPDGAWMTYVWKGPDGRQSLQALDAARGDVPWTLDYATLVPAGESAAIEPDSYLWSPALGRPAAQRRRRPLPLPARRPRAAPPDPHRGRGERARLLPRRLAPRLRPRGEPLGARPRDRPRAPAHRGRCARRDPQRHDRLGLLGGALEPPTRRLLVVARRPGARLLPVRRARGRALSPARRAGDLPRRALAALPEGGDADPVGAGRRRRPRVAGRHLARDRRPRRELPGAGPLARRRPEARGRADRPGPDRLDLLLCEPLRGACRPGRRRPPGPGSTSATTSTSSPMAASSGARRRSGWRRLDRYDGLGRRAAAPDSGRLGAGRASTAWRRPRRDRRRHPLPDIDGLGPAERQVAAIDLDELRQPALARRRLGLARPAEVDPTGRQLAAQVERPRHADAQDASRPSSAARRSSCPVPPVYPSACSTCRAPS